MIIEGGDGENVTASWPRSWTWVIGGSFPCCPVLGMYVLVTVFKDTGLREQCVVDTVGLCVRTLRKRLSFCEAGVETH